MKRCDQLREDLVMHAAGFLKSEDLLPLTSHLAACPDCQKEFRSMKRLVEVSENTVQKLPMPERDLRLREWFLGTIHPGSSRTRFQFWEREASAWPRQGSRWLMPALGVAAIAIFLFWPGNPKNQPQQTSLVISKKVVGSLSIPTAVPNLKSESSLGALRETILSNPDQWYPEFPGPPVAGLSQHYRVRDGYLDARD